MRPGRRNPNLGRKGWRDPAPAEDGSPPRRPLVSPWWDGVLAALTERHDLMGKVVTTDELVDVIRSLPGAEAARLRPMNAVRRLRPMLELVERGPNRSLSRGARYRIVRPAEGPPAAGDNDWLLAAAERMAGGGQKGKRRK